MLNRLSLIALIAGMSVAQARADEDPAGYLVSGQDGAPVLSGYGACVRTSQWTPDRSYRQCDPVQAAAQISSIEKASEPVLVRISMDMLFEFDSAVLGANAAPVLDKLAQELAGADFQTVRVVGRADRIGRARYNQQLSEQRAKAVRDYLAAHGIDAARIAASGVGSAESVTRAQCKDLQGKPLVACLQPDRSAEVTVIGTQTSAMR